MKISRPSAQMQDIIINNIGMSRYLHSLETGRPQTPRSWLYEDKSPEEILAAWEAILQTIDGSDTYLSRVYHFDISSKKKWGPQGKVAPINELLPLVTATYTKAVKPRAFDSARWKQAKEKTVKFLTQITGFKRLRPASYQHVVDDMRARDTLESNSGWPLFTRRNKSEVIRASIADAKSGKWREYPAIILFRNYNLKTRMVWMYPMSANLIEATFVQPLQRVLQEAYKPFFAPWQGFERVKQLISHTYSIGGFISATDYKDTDTHFTEFTTMEVFDVIKHCFQEAFWESLRESLSHVNTIPLLTGKDKLVSGHHGVSSGSNWTNFIETIFDMIFGYYVSMSSKGDVAALYAIGDDMAWVSYHYNAEFSEQISAAGKLVGQYIQTDKVTNKPESVTTLQRLFQRGYKDRNSSWLRGVYPSIRALNSAVYPEKFHNPKLWSSNMFCARIFMILENCVDHPLFDELVKFTVRGQKDLIPFAKLSATELHYITRETKLLPGFNPTYNQEKRDTSLAWFESIRIASTL